MCSAANHFLVQRICSLGTLRGYTLSKTNPHIFVSFKVILASGYYAAFRVTLVAKALEGLYDGAIHITTDYEVDLLFYIGLFYIESVMVTGFLFYFFSSLRY